MDALKKQLAKEDGRQQKIGVSSTQEMSPSAFLQRALEVEAVQ